MASVTLSAGVSASASHARVNLDVIIAPPLRGIAGEPHARSFTVSDAAVTCLSERRSDVQLATAHQDWKTAD
jgi:hypothetical protein